MVDLHGDGAVNLHDVIGKVHYIQYVTSSTLTFGNMHVWTYKTYKHFPKLNARSVGMAVPKTTKLCVRMTVCRQDNYTKATHCQVTSSGSDIGIRLLV